MNKTQDTTEHVRIPGAMSGEANPASFHIIKEDSQSAQIIGPANAARNPHNPSSALPPAPSRWLRGLDPQQRNAAEQIDGAALILAVPGSGKTTTLLARLGYMIERGVDPCRILVITFTRSAAREMQKRYAARGGAGRPAFMTINGFCYRVVNYYAWKSGHEKPRDEVDTGLRVRRLITEVYGEPYPTENDIRGFCQMITYIKNMQLTDEEIEAEKVGDYGVKPLYDAYQREMAEQKAMDYDDQLVYAYKLLRNVPWVRAYFQRKYPYVMVDEAQDTSHLQHEILRILVSANQNLFMVGDEDQSIYGFRAAYPDALLRFGDTYPGARIYRLETNYRSGKSIIDTANRSIRHNIRRYDKNMRAFRDEPGKVEIHQLTRRSGQYDEIVQLLRSEPERETAILYRNNDSAIPLIYCLDKAGIPCRSRGLDPYFFTSRAVLDAIDILTYAMHPLNRDLFWRIYYKFNYRIPKKAVYDATHRMDRRLEDPIMAALVTSPVMGKRKREALEDLRAELLEILRTDDALLAVQKLRTSMKYRNEKSEKLYVLEMLAEHGESVEDFLQKLKLLETRVRGGTESAAAAPVSSASATSSGSSIHTDSAIIHPDTTSQGKTEDSFAAVTLSTVHGSKGREYDRVILIDAISGILPSPDADLEEERRIFYVAVTRAKNSLILFDYRDNKCPFLRECDPSVNRNRRSAGIGIGATGAKGTAGSSPGGSGHSSGRFISDTAHGIGSGAGIPIGRVNSSLPSADDIPDYAERAKQYQPGVEVLSPSLGCGTVLSQDPEQGTVIVRFGNKGVRKFVLSICLQKGTLPIINKS